MADSTIVKTAGYSFQRRDETATPLCGAHRIASHAKNPLLVKAQPSAVKATTFTACRRTSSTSTGCGRSATA